jgi:tetratricopeptide (TPR) repeat protein
MSYFRCCFLGFLAVCVSVLVLGCGGTNDDNTARQTTPPRAKTAKVLDEELAGPEKISVASQESTLSQVNELLTEKKTEEAWLLIKPLLNASMPIEPVLFVAARIEASRGHLADAVELLERIPTDSPEAGLPALGQSAEWLADLGRLDEAVSKLNAVFDVTNDFPPAHRLLVRIYNAQGRRWRTRSHLRDLVRLGDFQRDELVMQVDFSEPFEEVELRQAARDADATSVGVRLGDARMDLYKNRFESALSTLRELHDQYPADLEVWVWLGHTLVAIGDASQKTEWLASRPSGCELHPQYWINLGRWAESLDKNDFAAYAYSKAIELDAMSLTGHSRLAENLILLGHEDLASAMRDRAQALANVHTLTQEYLRESAEDNAPQRLSEMYAGIGEDMLAVAWEMVALYKAQRAEESRKVFSEKMPDAVRDDQVASAQTIVATLPVDTWSHDIDSSLESLSVSDASETQLPESSPRSRMQMNDVAAERELSVSYDNGADMSRPGLLIFQGNGGGVGVIDYDRDGWTDLYFSEAGGVPLQDETNSVKQLQRSLAGERFVNVESAARISDRGYGQGIACGDVDQDGFPDLLVGNYGEDRLYLNNGDGTFSPSSIPQSGPMEQWTSSVAIADVTGDGLPDLLIGRYVSGEENLTKECYSVGADSKNCPPNEFPPCVNDIFVSDGRGGFESIDSEVRESMSDGRTMGILVANIDRKLGNDVFVSNDVSPNFLLVSQEKNGQRTLKEQAGRRGVGVDSGGRAQACMGIAFGDVDRNGLPDIAVTNFLNDLNTLYLQIGKGAFVDGTRKTNLNENALQFLGFGCQFLDIEDDGWLDFVLVNGHIDDYRQLGVPFKMQPQIFVNDQSIFRWLNDGRVGAYFDEPNLGRAMATLDYNNDHRIDLVTTHLDRPAGLIENMTQSGHHFIEFELVGVQCDRDAVGAYLELQSGDATWVADLTAGDGYLCSSQKLLHLGLGDREQTVGVVIHWPDGTTQTLSDLEVDRRYQIIQDVQ